MNVETVLIDSIVEDPVNARKHSSRNIDSIKASLAKFGQQKPIIVGEKNVVMAGSGTLQAAKALGWKEISIIRSTLTGIDAMGFGIADNRTAELAEWDYQTLAESLKALQAQGQDLKSLGWEDFELEPILGAEWKPPTLDADFDKTHVRGQYLFVADGQKITVDRAIEKIRGITGDPDMTEGRALELICADWLSGK